MAREGIAIAAARLSWVEHLTVMLQQDPAPFPHLALQMTGMAEELLGTRAALDAEDTLRNALKENRAGDAESGMTKFGPHRSDLAVYHVEKNCLASECSTGEQKALLISLALAQARLVTDLQGMAPLLLLDDVTAHLDEQRRAALCRALLDLGLQAWLSGTDESFFEGFNGKAQTFHIVDGHAK
jgi:DNA replication and repair protein RecF